MPARFDNERQFAQWNEAMARQYDPEDYHLRSSFLIRWIERCRVRTILRFLVAHQQDRVLEVGCGAGNVLEQVESGELFGIDLSAFLLKKSQRRLTDRRAKLVLANAERLPFADRRFHKLICTEVLEHVLDPRVLTREMARVATADAVIVISIPNEGWINRVKGVIRSLGLSRWLLKGNEDSYSSPDQMTDEWHLRSYDLTMLQETLKDILVIGEIKAIPHSAIPLRYVACCHLSKTVWHSDCR